MIKTNLNVFPFSLLSLVLAFLIKEAFLTGLYKGIIVATVGVKALARQVDDVRCDVVEEGLVVGHDNHDARPRLRKTKIQVLENLDAHRARKNQSINRTPYLDVTLEPDECTHVQHVGRFVEK